MCVIQVKLIKSTMSNVQLFGRKITFCQRSFESVGHFGILLPTSKIHHHHLHFNSFLGRQTSSAAFLLRAQVLVQFPELVCPQAENVPASHTHTHIYTLQYINTDMRTQMHTLEGAYHS